MTKQFTNKPLLKTLLSGAISFALITSLAHARPPTKRKPSAKGHVNQVHVSVGQPRHWTLDDAHYLLSNLYSRTRDIKIDELGNLDPNAFNSVRIDLAQNRLENLNGDSEETFLRRQNTIDAINAAREREIASLETQLTNLPNDPFAPDRVRLNQEIASQQTNINQTNVSIAELNSLKAIEDGKVQRLATEITRLESDITRAIDAQSVTPPTLANVNPSFADQEGDNTPSGEVDGNEQNQDSRFLGSVRKTFLEDDEVKDALIPSYTVSERLTKHITAENELLARQLTLL